MPSTDAERSAQGQAFAYKRWSQVPPGSEERSQATEAARAAFRAKFDSYPDPEAARRAFYADLRAKGLKARREKAARARAAMEQGAGEQ